MSSQTQQSQQRQALPSFHARVTAQLHEIPGLDRVTALCEGRLVADHPRTWSWHQTISDPEHVAAAKALQRQRVGLLRPVLEAEVEQRRLSDYDTALGLDTDGSTEGGVA